MEQNHNELDVTQATSPESLQSDVTPVDLPPPAVHGRGIRTGESIDPGAAKSAASNTGTLSPQSSDDELLGTTYVGKYELTSIIGSGGMGVIYQGRQIFLDRVVAIKMLKSNLGGERARMRFHQEAKAASQLHHPGIVAINDFGVDELDRPYMVMEHVEGCTFSDLIRERLTLSVQDALPIFLEICDALSIAHHKGIVHRDLKPSNIMLVVGADGKVHTKLLDFGIAKMLDIQEQTLQSMTKTGEALGTPLYMSPEQILGDKVTYRSDLYSLGCMMYMCLTGTPPFIGQNKLATMEKHCSAAPLPMKQASKGIDFPPGMEAIVMRLLEKKPADRFESVDELKDALIDMGVRNRFMRRPANESDAGQLYLTGAIPEMPKVVVDIVASPQISQASGLSGAVPTNEQRLYHKATERNSSDSGQSSKSFSSGFVLSAGVVLLVAVLGICFTAYSYFGQSSAGVVVKKPQVTLDKSTLLTNTTPSRNATVREEKAAPSADEIIHQKLLAGALDAEIRLANCKGLTEAGVKELAAFNLLRILDLSNTDFNGSWLQNLSKNNLTLLKLDNNLKVVNWSLYEISKMHNLVDLSLASTGISDGGMAYIAKNTSIRRLCLSNNRMISDSGVKKLIPERSKLTCLHINGCNISDKCAEDLSKFRDLEILNISDDPNISDACLQTLSSRESRLKCLDVAYDRIGVTGISSLPKFKDLVVLDLSYVRLGSESLKALANDRRLGVIYLQGCALTTSEIRKLAAALPSVRLEMTAGIVPQF